VYKSLTLIIALFVATTLCAKTFTMDDYRKSKPGVEILVVVEKPIANYPVAIVKKQQEISALKATQAKLIVDIEALGESMVLVTAKMASVKVGRDHYKKIENDIYKLQQNNGSRSGAESWKIWVAKRKVEDQKLAVLNNELTLAKKNRKKLRFDLTKCISRITSAAIKLARYRAIVKENE